MKAELEQLKAWCDKLEEDRRIVEIKNAGLGEAVTTLNSKVVGLEAKVSSERELRVASQHKLTRETVEKGHLARQVEELQGNNRVLAEEVKHMICGMSEL